MAGEQNRTDGFRIIDGILEEYKGSEASVSIPDGVTAIGKKAFEGCTSLASVSIPGSVTAIGKKAFYECSSLKTVKLSDGLEKVDSDWFTGLPDDFELLCTEGSKAYEAVKRSCNLKAHLKSIRTMQAGEQNAT